MSTIAANTPPGALTKGHKKVIFASSLGTVFEWYDFYLYGSLAAIIAAQFFSGVNETTGFIFALLAFAMRLRGASVRRDRVRPHRRHDRAQVHLPGHHRHHGHLDLPGRRAAQLRVDRHHRADHPDRPAPAAGPGAGRRVRRRGDLRGRARAQRQARPVHQLHPDHRHHRPVPVAAGDPGRARGPGHRSVQRLGLAHPVPAVDRAAGHLGVDPHAAARVAAVPADEGRGQDLQGADHRELLLQERQDRAAGAAGRDHAARRWCGTRASSTRCTSCRSR